MGKHILDRERVRSGSAKSMHYAQIDLTERPRAQSKVLQKRPRQTDLPARARRFLEIDLGKDQ